MRADQMIADLANEMANSRGLTFSQAVRAVLDREPELAAAYTRDPGAEVPVADALSRQDARSTVSASEHLRRAVSGLARHDGRMRGVPIDVALAEAAETLVATGRFANQSAAVHHLLSRPDIALAYQDDALVLGVVGGELHLSPDGHSIDEVTIACYPRSRHIITGEAA